jgi:Leucine-rich repeat (LRR) protein
MKNITRLTLAHNKITDVPPALATLENLEILNLFNNNLEELPGSLSGMPKLRSAAVHRLNHIGTRSQLRGGGERTSGGSSF